MRSVSEYVLKTDLLNSNYEQFLIRDSLEVKEVA